MISEILNDLGNDLGNFISFRKLSRKFISSRKCYAISETISEIFYDLGNYLRNYIRSWKLSHKFYLISEIIFLEVPSRLSYKTVFLS